LDCPEAWVRYAAIALGLLALALPMIRALRSSRAQRGRISGRPPYLASWPVALALGLAYVSAGILLWKPLTLAISPGTRAALLLVGSLLYFAGLAMYGWGFKTLGPMFGVSSVASAQLYEGHRLVTEGPYAYVRHPMYLGVMLAAIGALLLFRTWAMVVFAPLTAVVVMRARREERLLADEFGDEWSRYQARVPGWIPHLKRNR
jgi:protein-S-isoprenylcysteine O-methyltransferase Ste14